MFFVQRVSREYERTRSINRRLRLNKPKPVTGHIAGKPLTVQQLKRMSVQIMAATTPNIQHTPCHTNHLTTNHSTA